jgi:hypothetical protein
MKVYLRELAHARAGDKGDISNISVIAYKREDYGLIKEQVTAARVKEHFKDLVKGEVLRYELPKLKAFNFVLHQALGGGVTRSLSLDPHGKSYSAVMLTLEVEVSEEKVREIEQRKKRNEAIISST